MTSKLKCPFCQKRLSQGYNHDRDTVIYHCNNCYFQGDGIIWIALIQAKQDLEIVVDALKPFADRDNWDFEHCFVDNPQLLAGTALEQIEHKEKQNG